MNRQPNNEPPIKLQVRLPPSLHQKLVEIAAENDRSLNGQVVAMLRRAAEEEKQTQTE